MQRAQSRAQQLTLQKFLPANCGFPGCYFVPLWFASSFDWVGAGENLRMLRGCGNLISEIKKGSPGDRRGLGQVHVVSQKGAGPAPRPAESRGALLAGRHPAWSPPAARPGAGLRGHVLPHALRPPASGATTLPWGRLGFLRPTSGPPPEHILSSLACNCTNCPLGRGESGPHPHNSGFQSRNLRQSHIAQPRPRLRSPQTTSCPFQAPPAPGCWQLHAPGLCCSSSPHSPPARCTATFPPTGRA